MTILLILVAIIAAVFIMYKLKKQTPKIEVNNAPEKIEPPILVKKTESAIKEVKKAVKETPKKTNKTTVKVKKNIK
jgi:cell division protein ZapA (FtsZ GTPase activity inhibitor)